MGHIFCPLSVLRHDASKPGEISATASAAEAIHTHICVDFLCGRTSGKNKPALSRGVYDDQVAVLHVRCVCHIKIVINIRCTSMAGGRAGRFFALTGSSSRRCFCASVCVRAPALARAGFSLLLLPAR